MKVLVCGGAGYIGSHTCKALHAAGYEPVVYDNLSQGHEWAVKWGPLIIGDIADQTLLINTLKKFDISAVLHFAAYAYVGESVIDPRKYFENNVANSLTLFGGMLDAGIKMCVFSSSCATYGDPLELPVTEDHPQKPVSPYGASKLFVEQILNAYLGAYGLRYGCLRYFNAAGADPQGELGEDHDPETHLIPRLIAAAQGKIPHVEIFGTDYATRDGTAIRDYVHVTDLADAHVAALNRLVKGELKICLNLGTGNGSTIGEVISIVESVSGQRVPFRERPRRQGDPATLVASAARAETELGWRPKMSDLRTIVGTSWRWHEKRMESTPVALTQTTTSP